MKLIKQMLLVAVLAMAGCSGGGSHGGNDLLGNIVGGKYGAQANAGLKLFDAATYIPDEDELGRTVAIAATNQWRLYDKPELTRYVTMVGLTLADSSSQPGGNWVFGVLDTPEI